MKQLLAITGVILIAFLLLMNALAPAAQSASQPDVAAGREAAQGGYRIGVSGDRVAVFRNGSLYLRTDTPVSSLPKSDRKRLAQGIDVDSETELKTLLQDYCS